MSAFWFLVSFPESDKGMFWIGGGLKPSKNAGKVWLTRPGGEPVVEVSRSNVRPTTKEEVAKLIQAELIARRAPLN